ncbi:hypothetical protein ABVK25_012405 [Lepraria finkii]|uniref:Uncharacterized protein n=1 Tax=Lepraria finkii TaxID=1340010 RepID=A0ABR4AFI0_9LECA
MERRQAEESAQTHASWVDGFSLQCCAEKDRRGGPKQPRETVIGIEGEKERWVRRRLEEVRGKGTRLGERAKHVQGELDKLGKEVEGLDGEKGKEPGDGGSDGALAGATQAGRSDARASTSSGHSGLGSIERTERSGVGTDGDMELG